MASAHSDSWYLSLLGLAENFRTSNPPNIRLCIHCLQTIFNFKPPPRIEARTHLQLGQVLYSHTKNTDLARSHLEKAWTLTQAISSFDEVKFESASILCQLLALTNLQEAKSILQKAIEFSQQSPYWHCRLLFQLAELLSQERDYVSACGLLGLGADYAGVKHAEYTKILFMLSKAMLLLIDKKLKDVNSVLAAVGVQIEALGPSVAHRESLRVFFLVLQVCHYLMAGQVKSVKPALKQLQQSIQTITSLQTDDETIHTASNNPGDLFQWLPKEHMCVLVYLVTVMHSLQAGYMDKAQKYTDKALMQIEKLKMVDNHPLLHQFQLMLLEHIVMCRLIMGNKTMAIQEIYLACNVCQQHPRLFQTHGSQIHALLGLYAMSMNCMEAAEGQFKTALSQLMRIGRTSDHDLITFINLNLAIIYLRTNRQADLAVLLEHVEPDRIGLSPDDADGQPPRFHSLRASAYYVKGLQSFFQARYHEAKKYLRETLKMANAEDLNRLTSCSLVLLGHTFLSLGNSKEALNMVTPAMQLASKIPDVHVQLWASALLKDLYRLCGDAAGEAEGFRLHESFSQSLLKDHFQSSQQAEHKLIYWTEGPCPFHLESTSTMNSTGLL